MTEQVQITAGNAEQRIRDAMSTIIGCWTEWDAGACQQAQIAQQSDAWLFEMQDQLGAVLTGMVFHASLNEDSDDL